VIVSLAIEVMFLETTAGTAGNLIGTILNVIFFRTGCELQSVSAIIIDISP
jgi:hypothetical protein